MASVAQSDTPSPARRAYSYLRFSTPQQSKGNSFKRQMALATSYASRHGLELDLDLTFHDLGVSGYRGQNLETGRLGYFLEAVQAGQVAQGSVLLVEHLDRLSRLSPRKALRVLEGICELGVSVVTLNDEREYTTASLDSDLMDLLVSILSFARANEESVTKGRRLKASWNAKRADIANRPLTGRLPAWLHLSQDRMTIEVHPDRAAVIRRIFSMAVEGAGQHKIAETFNLEGLAPWGRGQFWQRSYIAKILANPAVIGTLQPHVLDGDGPSKSRTPLEPVADYFPPVVDFATYQEAQALRQALGAPQRGRHAHAPVSNILAGLAACPQCGATMTRVNKGKRSRPSLVCTKAKVGAGCEYRSVPYHAVYDALLARLPERLEARDGIGADDALDMALRGAEEAVDGLRRQASNLLDNLAMEHSPAIVQRLRETEVRLEEAEQSLRGLRDRQEAATGLTVAARIARARAALQPPEGAVDIAQVNRALRSLFKRAVIDWRTGTIELDWTHGGTLSLPYTANFVAAPGWTWGNEGIPNDD